MLSGIPPDATAANAFTKKRAASRAKPCSPGSQRFSVADPMLSAVIACYQDAPAIPLMYARLTAVLSALAVDYEIIFVNDGSPDDTDSVLQALTSKDDHVLAIEHSRNFG